MIGLIIGTGDMAHALSHQYAKTAKDEEKYSIKIASATREFTPNTTFHDTGIAFVPLEEGITEAEIVFLAIPGKALFPFLETYANILRPSLLV